MAVKETYVRARVDNRLKRDSELILHELGLTTTDAIRMLLSLFLLEKRWGIYKEAAAFRHKPLGPY